MGLKTTNYVSKSTGITLPTAYARIKDLVLNGHNGRAIFAIQSTREAVENYQAIDKVEVHFVWDRKSNPVVQAYEAAKVQTIEKHNDETGETVIENGVLFGWKDDIV